MVGRKPKGTRTLKSAFLSEYWFSLVILFIILVASCVLLVLYGLLDNEGKGMEVMLAIGSALLVGVVFEIFETIDKAIKFGRKQKRARAQDSRDRATEELENSNMNSAGSTPTHSTGYDIEAQDLPFRSDSSSQLSDVGHASLTSSGSLGGLADPGSAPERAQRRRKKRKPKNDAKPKASKARKDDRTIEEEEEKKSKKEKTVNRKKRRNVSKPKESSTEDEALLSTPRGSSLSLSSPPPRLPWESRAVLKTQLPSKPPMSSMPLSISSARQHELEGLNISGAKKAARIPDPDELAKEHMEVEGVSLDMDDYGDDEEEEKEEPMKMANTEGDSVEQQKTGEGGAKKPTLRRSDPTTKKEDKEKKTEKGKEKMAYKVVDSGDAVEDDEEEDNDLNWGLDADDEESDESRKGMDGEAKGGSGP